MTRYDVAKMVLESHDCPETLQYLHELKASHDALLDYAHRHKEGIVYGEDCHCAYCSKLPEAIKCAESLR